MRSQALDLQRSTIDFVDKRCTDSLLMLRVCDAQVPSTYSDVEFLRKSKGRTMTVCTRALKGAQQEKTQCASTKQFLLPRGRESHFDMLISLQGSGVVYLRWWFVQAAKLGTRSPAMASTARSSQTEGDFDLEYLESSAIPSFTSLRASSIRIRGAHYPHRSL